MRSSRPLSAVVLLGLILVGTAVISSARHVPALFIFGDSLADVGTNNYITGYPLLPQANIVPYGETFFHYPTGRWSDGRLIFDFIAEYLSLPYPQPYIAPSSDSTRFYKGANFASAGSGILDTTYLWEGVINLSVQVEQYSTVVAELKKKLGHDKAYEIFCESIYVFVTGNNDVSQYASNSTLQQQYSPEQYIELLITKLGRHIKAGLPPQPDLAHRSKDLIGNEVTVAPKVAKATQNETAMDDGARKIVIGDMGPIGCVPRALAAIGSNGTAGPCSELLNQIALGFDAGLLNYVTSINAQMNSTYVILGTTYNTTYDLVMNGRSQGFTHGATACCGGGPYEGVIACGRGNYTLCSNVSEYFYWDYTHLTERAYKIYADLLWNGDTSVSVPINIRQLTEL